MIFSLIIFFLTVGGITVSSIIKPSIKVKNYNINLYWIISLLSLILLLCSRSITLKEFIEGLFKNGEINPLQIVILFISMSLISISLDELGLFSYLANSVLKKCGKSQYSIFTSLYILIAFLTIFTSNDIVILTLTPFIIFFTKRANINPIPYLVSEFICANTYSLIFIIGNPTNIYLASSFEINFIGYFLKMVIPTLVAGLCEYILLRIIFRKDLKKEITKAEIVEEHLNKVLVGIGVAILLLCTILLVISSYINLPMYLICFSSLILLLIVDGVYYAIKKEKPSVILSSLKRGPYELIPFIFGMFSLVLALNKYNITKEISTFLSGKNEILTYGYSSLLICNIINNIPMSVLYSSILSYSSNANAIYASIIGSNLGAFITPFGALAGLMWINILKKHNIKYSYTNFIKTGLFIALPTSSIMFLLLFLL